MNKKQLIDMGLSEELADSIIVLHGKDIESHKGKLTAAESQTEALKAQLAEAGTTIEGFKKLDVEGIKKAADEYKAAAEKAQADGAAQVAKIKFDHALEKELKEFKVKDPGDIIPHLKADMLKLGEDGKFVGLKEQIDPLKVAKDYLFESDTATPRIVTGGQSKPILGDAVVNAARNAAGLPAAQGK